MSDVVNSVDADSVYLEGADIADTKAPAGPIEKRWDERRFNAKLVNPANRRQLSIIIVGTGLAGSSAAATIAAVVTIGFLVPPFAVLFGWVG